MAVCALHQAFVHPVAERARELLLLVLVAAITQLWLLLLHEELSFLRVVWIVAVDASNAVGQMHRSRVVAVLLAVLMAIETSRARFLCRNSLECENLAFVPAALHMLFSGTMASLTPMPFGPPF